MGAGARILVVEDEWLIAEDHAAQLRAAGHRVVGPVPSVQKALKALDDEPVDLALLDIELRGEDSYPIAETLRARGVPFAFLSGYADRVLPPGMRDEVLILKPVEPGLLLAAVDRLCP